MNKKEITDKIFKILCENTGIVAYEMDTTDDLRHIMDSVDIIAFLMDIQKEFNLNNVSIENEKPITIDRIVETVVAKQKKIGKNIVVNDKKSIIYTDFSKIDKDLKKDLEKRRPYSSSDCLVPKYNIPDLREKTR